MTRFAGWPDEALEFFEGLEADNSKAYWQDNKDRYQRAVKGPMDALLAEVAPEFGPFKIFRAYRDVRFSADKSPYKTEISASAPEAALYLSYSARGLFTGAGYWHMSRDQLVRYRAAIDGPPGDELEAIGAALEADHLPIEGEGLKTAPKGWPADHPRIKLLRYTSVLAHRHYPPAAWMATAEAKERVVSVWRNAGPLVAWLTTHVGVAEESGRR
ncbi:MAG: DUF2461 domain-containing protein [Actinomycetota bacterium]|nr:DUF2461 domain-containing protein [Actinomycetota bacterium]